MRQADALSGESVRALGDFIEQSLRREHFPDIPFERLFVDCADALPLRGFLPHLGAVIAMEISLLDPGTVILGGVAIMMDGSPPPRWRPRSCATPESHCRPRNCSSSIPKTAARMAQSALHDSPAK